MRSDAPRKGARIDAALDANRLIVTRTDVTDAAAWLDARLVDLGHDLTLVLDGTERTLTPAPRLQTLCTTLAERGDPLLAASWIVPLR